MSKAVRIIGIILVVWAIIGMVFNLLALSALWLVDASVRNSGSSSTNIYYLSVGLSITVDIIILVIGIILILANPMTKDRPRQVVIQGSVPVVPMTQVVQ